MDYKKQSSEMNEDGVVITSQQAQEQKSKANCKQSDKFLLDELYSEKHDDFLEESDGDNNALSS